MCERESNTVPLLQLINELGTVDASVCVCVCVRVTVPLLQLINELGTVDARLAPQLRQLLSGTNRPAGTKPAGTPSETKIERVCVWGSYSWTCMWRKTCFLLLLEVHW